MYMISHIKVISTTHTAGNKHTGEE